MSKQYAEMLNNVANAVGTGLQNAASYSGKAAAKANAATAGFQSAQGAFNAGQAAIANDLGSGRIAQQYGYNSAQAASANDFTQQMWNQASGWNEEMFERQMKFNAEQAELNRQWQERMDSTKYQRAIKDMETAGLNPILAVTGGGISTGSGGGSSASVSAPSMSGASGAMASGGLLQGVSASEGMGTGQMEYMSGLLGLLGAGMSGLSSAIKYLGDAGLSSKDVGDVIVNIMSGTETSKSHSQEMADLQDKSFKEKIQQGIEAMTAYKAGTTTREWYRKKGYSN